MSRAETIKIVAVLGAMLATALLAFWPFSFSSDGPFRWALMDAGHFPFFLGVTLGINWCLQKRIPRATARITAVAAISLAMVTLIELLQPLAGRTATWPDLRNGVLGVSCAVTLLVLRERRAGRLAWSLFGLAATIALGLVLQPAWQEGRALLWRAKHFPALGQFETECELRLWLAQGGAESPTTTELSSLQSTEGRRSLRVRAAAGDWAGVTCRAGDRDWSGFEALALDVFNAGEPFRLSLRVDDDGDCSRYGKRYDGAFELAAGWNHLRVKLAEIEDGPRDRKLNTKTIRRLILFTGKREPAREFFLDNVRLEPK